jgi:hypothetical protein
LPINGLGIAEEVAFEKRKFNLVMKFNINTKVQHLQVSHFFGNTLLCVRAFVKTNENGEFIHTQLH